jgi:hypothetical protein
MFSQDAAVGFPILNRIEWLLSQIASHVESFPMIEDVPG